MKNIIKINGSESVISTIQQEIECLGLEQFVLSKQFLVRQEKISSFYTSISWFIPGSGLLSYRLTSKQEIEIYYSTFEKIFTPSLGISKGLSSLDPGLKIEHIAKCEQAHYYASFNFSGGRVIDSFVIDSYAKTCQAIEDFLLSPSSDIESIETNSAVKALPGQFNQIGLKRMSGYGLDYIDEVYHCQLLGGELHLVLSYDLVPHKNRISRPYITDQGQRYELVNIHWNNLRTGMSSLLSEQHGFVSIEDVAAIVPTKFLYDQDFD